MPRARAQCIVHRGNRLLMVKQPFWVLPGGGVDDGERPRDAVIRELREECHVDGTIIRLASIQDLSRVAHAAHERIYTFLVDIGEQTPRMGTDPELEGADPYLADVRWLTLADIPERDRAFLWAAGLLDIKEFYDEVTGWGDSLSYPNKNNTVDRSRMRFDDMERFQEFPEFRTRRLILREMTLGDLDFYFRHFNEPQIVDSCCHPGPATLEDAKNELERYCINPFQENRGIRWGIAYKSTEELIGTVGFYDWNKSVRKVEVGYDLTPRYWGRGIMTEALRAVLRFCFSTLKFHRIQAIIDADNHRSIDLVQRLGFIKEGVLRHNSLFNGQYRDDVCFSLLIEDWKNDTD